MSNQSLTINSKLQIVFNLIKKKTKKTHYLLQHNKMLKERVANKVSHGTHVVFVIIYNSGIFESQRTSLFHSGNECHCAHRKQSSEVAMAFSAQT